jgi:hypothetical protein
MKTLIEIYQDFLLGLRQEPARAGGESDDQYNKRYEDWQELFQAVHALANGNLPELR